MVVVERVNLDKFRGHQTPSCVPPENGDFLDFVKIVHAEVSRIAEKLDPKTHWLKYSQLRLKGR